MTFKRICKTEFLNAIYAPGGKPGDYFILSQAISWFIDRKTIIGHIVLLTGKPVKIYMQ